MTDTWSQPLGELFDTIRVESAASFILGGRRFPVHPATSKAAQREVLEPVAGAPAEATPEPPTEHDAEPFVTALSLMLYRYVYSHAYHGTLEQEIDRNESPEEARARRAARQQPDQDLLARLSTANATHERWEHGWSIAQVMPNGQIQAKRGSLLRLVWPGQFLSKDGPGAQPRVGAEISLFYSKESNTLQQGFYYLFGETPEEQHHAYGIMRLYWNVSPAGAPPLIGAISSTLNRFQVPFRMKCAVALAEYERTDAAVLYLPKVAARFVVDLLPQLYPQVAEHLEQDVPFFSRQLAPGLGLAEDPGTGESFGQHRCRLVAEAVWNCFLRQEESTAARISELRRLFVEHGVHEEHSHMNAHSQDWYELPEVIDERAA